LGWGVCGEGIQCDNEIIQWAVCDGWHTRVLRVDNSVFFFLLNWLFSETNDKIKASSC
jgi:hypothetical protein